jgi:hypothetical protein
MPIGYVINPDNILEALPDWDKIKLIEEALDFVDAGRSYREVATWLSTVIGRTVSHQAIANWWKKQRKTIPGNVRAKVQRARKRKLGPKTGKDKAEAAVKVQVAAAKRSLTVRQKKLAGFKDPEPDVNLPDSYFVQNTTLLPNKNPLEGKEIIFEPNEGPQTDFLAASEQEVLYGGAAGG